MISLLIITGVVLALYYVYTMANSPTEEDLENAKYTANMVSGLLSDSLLIMGVTAMVGIRLLGVLFFIGASYVLLENVYISFIPIVLIFTDVLPALYGLVNTIRSMVNEDVQSLKLEKPNKVVYLLNISVIAVVIGTIL